jgi:hypothetical protein
MIAFYDFLVIEGQLYLTAVFRSQQVNLLKAGELRKARARECL